ncbi:phage tail protein [Escherichia coli]|uniref:tail fiber assembly protein n=1 Tax=Enterobacterales TaxID=91347 RepID=UPI000B54419B|nr:tail fiber assembly protein [Escherichia coli]ASG50766.1 phage tail protein [Escherichia coli]HAY5638750.1 tail fiber assembly protein [Escherichia coli]HCQ0228924.1 tail fiber assembly protein [Escherichia coli]
MANYALIRNGVVGNVVIWDGEGDIFADYTTVIIDGLNAGIGWSYDGKTFTAPPVPELTREEYVGQAESTKAGLLSSARTTISIWQSELLLGSISDADKASLVAWLAYIKAVEDIDTSTAPDINWPEPPAE